MSTTIRVDIFPCLCKRSKHSRSILIAHEGGGGGGKKEEGGGEEGEREDFFLCVTFALYAKFYLYIHCPIGLY